MLKHCFLSIDFEDFTHDFQKNLGIPFPQKRPDTLWKAYERILEFCDTRLDGKRLTFFTTGQVARDYPDLVRRISLDGHEIACHYYEHDTIYLQSREQFRKNLSIAIEFLSNASGQIINGFRAPDFSIDDKCAGWAYEELANFFKYDSSYVTNKIGTKRYSPLVFKFEKSHLIEYPLYKRHIFPGLSIRVLGGSFFKLLPSNLILKYLNEAWFEGFITHIYLHPYELLHDYEQWSSLQDLRELSVGNRFYWGIRQHQWHTFGNRQVFEKLNNVYTEFTHPGTFKEYTNRVSTQIHH